MTTSWDSGGGPKPDIEQALGGLRPFSSGLEANGYALNVSRDGSTGLGVEIVAGPDACEECLTPKDMLNGMVRSRLASERVEFSDSSVVYPTG